MVPNRTRSHLSEWCPQFTAYRLSAPRKCFNFLILYGMVRVSTNARAFVLLISIFKRENVFQTDVAGQARAWPSQEKNNYIVLPYPTPSPPLSIEDLSFLSFPFKGGLSIMYSLLHVLILHEFHYTRTSAHHYLIRYTT